MIDIKALASDPQKYKKVLTDRGADPTEADRVLSVNENRKKKIQEAETLKASQNKINEQIAQLKRNKQDATNLLEQMKSVAQDVKRLEAEAAVIDTEVLNLLLRLPNYLHASTPIGVSTENNKQIKKWGEIKKFNFKPKEHWELGEALGVLDFERAGKVAGARFSFVKAQAATVERALISFMLDTHTREHGYVEMVPPFMVNTASFTGTGQLPKFQNDLFWVTEVTPDGKFLNSETNYGLIPTAEVPVTNYYREETLNEDQLPQAFAAYSPCFRAEAGSYGKDTKGLIRQHQFNKVEIMRFCHPQKSYEELELLTTHAEKMLQLLELPYRVMALCSGDIGFGSAKTYDLEVWLPGQNAYREISSCSNFEDFQARRANIRFRPKAGGKPEFVHTLNGSGLAVGRTLVAILENFQQEDGTVLVPKVLQKYCGFEKIEKAKN
ncbi:MAG: serine--tRNA ligase [Oligoflexia bacterium]|nr:serine--tRNA ligase [Oligoflexia bacterium]